MSDGGFWENFLYLLKTDIREMFTLLASGHGSVKMGCLELLQQFCQNEIINQLSKTNMLRMAEQKDRRNLGS